MPRRNSMKKRKKEPSGLDRLDTTCLGNYHRWNHDISHFFCCHLFPSILGPFLSTAPFRGERENEKDNLIKGGHYSILLTQPSMTCFLLRVFGCLTCISPAARPWPPVQKYMGLYRQDKNQPRFCERIWSGCLP
jgi:hypothetical protein